MVSVSYSGKFNAIELLSENAFSEPGETMLLLEEKEFSL